MARDVIQKLSYSHEAMINLMVAKPTISGKELAEAFGFTETWVSLVRSSNAFKERLRERTQEMVDPLLAATVEEQFDIMVNRSLQVLNEKLAEPVEQIDPTLALQCATLGAKARGYGGFGAKQTAIVVPRSPDWLEQSANRLRSLNQGVVDVQANEIPNAG